MKKSTNKNSTALFDIADITIKKINKDDSTTNNKSDSRKSNDNSSNISFKKSSRAVKKVRKVDGDDAKINAESKSKRSKNNKVDKPKRTTDEKYPISIEQPTKDEKVKVGRRDRKHNWWNGCDYVWVDGIDHWVSKTAFKNDPNSKPIYTLQNYVPGLDSYVCLRYKTNKFITESEKALESANEELRKKYKSWKDLSSNGKLKEKFIEKYKDHILWFTFLEAAENEGIIFSDGFKKKFNDKFRLYNIIK